MKKLALFIALFFSMNLFVHAQYSPDLKANVSLKLIGKYHMVITYLESKEFYTPGTTQSEFVESNMSFFDREVRPTYIADYLAKVYSYHTKNLTPDQVYALDDGSAFCAMANGAVKLLREGMTKEEIELAIATGNNPDVVLKFPKWFNFVRKIIDLIDETFGGGNP